MTRLIEATLDDAEEIAALHTAVAKDLTVRHGRGPWSSITTAKGVLFGMKRAKVFITKKRQHIVATLSLSTRKPWAIDKAYFAHVARPLYLTGMAVAAAHQGKGLGSRCVAEALRIAKAWPADVVRLDAYDSPGGAGEFYAKCGFTEVARVVYRNVPLVYFESISRV
ncbi:MAG TPA: GNAT family N-acetyltransferase [Thermoanaerobaculia bacterium]|jgi:GNAT superfamily N-acetyltransferase|nr:GNAT family N-acetyltransferase [Thermoanaerobaculia bacterium]